MAVWRNKLAMALGGGGARGFAHVGVLEGLLARGVDFNGIVGTSAGSVAGGGFALGRDPARMREQVLRFADSPLASDSKVRALIGQSESEGPCGLMGWLERLWHSGRVARSLLLDSTLLGEDYIARLVNFFLPKVDIESLPLPFAAVATDLVTGDPVILDHGPLRKAVLASSAVPGMAPPVELDGRQLVDGGVVCQVPVTPARRWCGGPVLAVSVDKDLADTPLKGEGFGTFMRANDIMSDRLVQMELAQADLVIHPQVGEVHWVDFRRAQWVMDQGRQALEEAWPQVQKLLERPPARKWWGFWRQAS